MWVGDVGGVVAGAAVLLLIHIVGSFVGEMVWRIDKGVITVSAWSCTGWWERRVIVVETEEVRLLVRHGGAVRW